MFLKQEAAADRTSILKEKESALKFRDYDNTRLFGSDIQYLCVYLPMIYQSIIY